MTKNRTATEQGLPRDTSGFPYGPAEYGMPAWRLTECCGASVTYVDGGYLACKGCYEDADPAVDAPARLTDAEPILPDTGPIVIRLDRA